MDFDMYIRWTFGNSSYINVHTHLHVIYLQEMIRKKIGHMLKSNE